MPENVKQKITTYREFWPFYLGQHAHPTTKLVHVIGTSIASALILGFAISGRYALIPVGIVVGYAFAWYSHFFIEKNRPATFTYPFWSFISDYKMAYLYLTGKLR